MASCNARIKWCPADVGTRAGPQNEKWSYQQKTLDPTGSIHFDLGARSAIFGTPKMAEMGSFEKF